LYLCVAIESLHFLNARIHVGIHVSINDDINVSINAGIISSIQIITTYFCEMTRSNSLLGLSKANRGVRRPDLTLVTVDHNIPTSSRKNFSNVASFVTQKDSKQQVLTLEENVEKFKLTYFGMDDSRQGIVHVIGPEQGFTLPGTTLVCGDSHTSTHGAFGALAFGIGTSEVEHVLATQTILQKKSKNMRINVVGELAEGVGAKDIVLHIIGEIGIRKVVQQSH
jgi:3-isopropylmalate dehydratase